MISRAAMIAAFLSTLGASSVVAREKDALPLGLPIGVKARLSTTSVPGLVNGIVVRTDHESATFLLERGTEHKVPVEDIQRLEVSFSQKRHTLMGALVGIAVGVGMGFVFPVDPDNCGYETSSDFCSRGEAVAGAVLTFGLIGTGVGALVRTDRWTTVNLESLKGTAPSGPRSARLKPAVSFTLRF